MPDPSQVERVHSENLALPKGETTERLHGVHHTLSTVVHAAELIRKLATASPRQSCNIWERRDTKIG